MTETISLVLWKMTACSENRKSIIIRVADMAALQILKEVGRSSRL